LLPKARPKAACRCKARAVVPGIAIGQLSGDQKDIEQTIKIVLASYRQGWTRRDDAEGGGGADALHMALPERCGGSLIWATMVTGDLASEAPTFVWHFRGQPHAHVCQHWQRTTVKLGLFSVSYAALGTDADLLALIAKAAELGLTQ
jgi:hypothetical protein